MSRPLLLASVSITLVTWVLVVDGIEHRKCYCRSIMSHAPWAIKGLKYLTSDISVVQYKKNGWRRTCLSVLQHCDLI